ncbi:hypothetical protein ACFLYG_02800 [Chloroflexota bacterium]
MKDMNAHVACVNELGFPACDCIPLERADKWTREKAEEYGSLIIAGTCHDGRTWYNTGYLYYPDCPPFGYPFHKQVS